MMFDQVRFFPVKYPSAPEHVSCCDVASLHKPECPTHIGQMMESPFKYNFKGAHFEKYDKMYHTGTWSYPLLRSLIPKDAFLLPIFPAYAIQSTTTESLWGLQVRSCANGARMQQGIHYDESFSPVTSIENILIILNLRASQVKSVFIIGSKTLSITPSISMQPSALTAC
jgi:hypothetical protein